jgi:hypothetical protein
LSSLLIFGASRIIVYQVIFRLRGGIAMTCNLRGREIGDVPRGTILLFGR